MQTTFEAHSAELNIAVSKCVCVRTCRLCGVGQFFVGVAGYFLFGSLARYIEFPWIFNLASFLVAQKRKITKITK